MKQQIILTAFCCLSVFAMHAQMQYGIFMEGNWSEITFKAEPDFKNQFSSPGFAIGSKAAYTWHDQLEIAILGAVSFVTEDQINTDVNGTPVSSSFLYPVTVNVPLQVSYLFLKNKKVRPLVFGGGGMGIRISGSDFQFDSVRPYYEVGTGANIAFARFNMRPEFSYRGGKSLYKTTNDNLRSTLSQFAFRLVFQG